MFQREETVRAIASHSLLPEVLLRNLLRNNLEATKSLPTLELDEAGGYMKTTEHFRFVDETYHSHSDKGCPFAVTDDNDKLKPLFVKFTKWASELSIRSLIEQKNQKTG